MICGVVNTRLGYEYSMTSLPSHQIYTRVFLGSNTLLSANAYRAVEKEIRVQEKWWKEIQLQLLLLLAARVRWPLSSRVCRVSSERKEGLAINQAGDRNGLHSVGVNCT
jgi:hypothetical protein